MELGLCAIFIILVIILHELRRGNFLKKVTQIAVQRELLAAEYERAEAERERQEAEKRDANQQQKYDVYLVANGLPHWNDKIRVAEIASMRNISDSDAEEFLMKYGFRLDVEKSVNESKRNRQS
jgi:hypothetical protein